VDRVSHSYGGKSGEEGGEDGQNPKHGAVASIFTNLEQHDCVAAGAVCGVLGCGAGGVVEPAYGAGISM
jgi:hypothetical protein